MQNQIRRGYRCPRWLAQNGIIVPLTYEEAVAHPSVFCNETMYRMRLVGLSFTADLEPTADDPPVWPPHAAWANELVVEVGKSGCSDMNAVAGSISALCATPVSKRYKNTGLSGGPMLPYPSMDVRFPHPVRIPRDCGLEVKLSQRGGLGSFPTALITFCARGYDEDGRHVVMAGDFPNLKGNSGEVILDSADLINNGKKDAFLRRMMVVCKYAFQPVGGSVGYNPYVSQIGLVVNPTHGTAWMPTDEPIPLGNVMPMCTFLPDWTDGSPRVYLFPEATYLDSDQHLAVRLYPHALDEQDFTFPKINVCLFGELEVE